MRRRACIGALLVTLMPMTSAHAMTKCLPEPEGARGYDKFLLQELHRRSIGRPLFTYVVTPSFDMEYGLVLTKVGAGYSLSAVTFTESVWEGSVVEPTPGYFEHRFSPDKVKAQAKQVDLDADVASALIGLLNREMVAAASREPRIGADGVSYKLSSSDGRCAWAWSPEDNSHDAIVVNVLRELHTSVNYQTAAFRAFLQKLHIRTWKEAPRL